MDEGNGSEGLGRKHHLSPHLSVQGLLQQSATHGMMQTIELYHLMVLEARSLENKVLAACSFEAPLLVLADGPLLAGPHVVSPCTRIPMRTHASVSTFHFLYRHQIELGQPILTS